MTLRLPFRAADDLPLATAAVREALRSHGVVAIPTESFYGLAADPRDERAVARVFAAKGRPAGKELPVVGASIDQLEELVVVPESLRDWLRSVWPAALTVVLPARRPLPAAGATLGVRVPAHPLLRRLLACVGPLTATSANRSGREGLVDPDAVLADLGSGVDVLLDGGPTPGGLPSTILDATSRRLRLVRAGSWNAGRDLRVKIV